MSSLTRTATSAVITAGVVVGTTLAAAPAGATALKGDYFVVDTQGTGTSEIVDAGGGFSGCTTVTDLTSNIEFVRPKVYFTGDKLVTCEAGELTIHYAVVQAGKKTHGSWYVVASTVPGITEGFGRLDGNALACTPDPGSDFCILDTFVGTLG